MTEGELKTALRDPDWRLRNLYWVLDKDGHEVLFKPWPMQERFLHDLWFRNLILKARQLGYSTLVQLVMLDSCVFNKNLAAAVIAQDKEAAEKIFRTKIKFAYDRLPEMVKAINPLVKNSASELILANGSSLSVSTSARSATLQWLHISEFGKICSKYPDKAEEIITGSLPAVDANGIVCIELTAHGQEGAFYDMEQRAQQLHELGKDLAKSDYRFHFAPWWEAGEYEADPASAIVAPLDNAYFARLEAEIGEEIGPRKRAWYIGKRDADFSGDRELMMREYPATAEEAFAQSIEGVYLADQLAAARRDGRITTVPHDPSRPVNTFWDLHHGGNDAVSIWFHQRQGLRDHFIRFIEGSGEPYSFYVQQMQALGYVLGKHYLPHDAGRRFPGAETNPTIEDMLLSSGYARRRSLTAWPTSPPASSRCVTISAITGSTRRIAPRGCGISASTARNGMTGLAAGVRGRARMGTRTRRMRSDKRPRAIVCRVPGGCAASAGTGALWRHSVGFVFGRAKGCTDAFV